MAQLIQAEWEETDLIEIKGKSYRQNESVKLGQ